MSRTTFHRRHRASRAGYRAASGIRGFSLVELMISLMLGLLVVGSAGAIFISNRQTYRATEGLGRVQENSRMAYELMARDMREAGGNPCGKNLLFVDVLNPTVDWWSNWNRGLTGYESSVASPGTPFGTAFGNRIAGTDAVDVMSGDNSSGVTVVSHNPSSAQFHLNTVNHVLDDSDIAIVCDNRQMALFQITNAQPGTNEVIVHNTGNTASPGNCTKGLGYPPPKSCPDALGTPYTYGANSMIVKLHAVRWYIGRNRNGTNSLFRVSLGSNGAGAAVTTDQEIAEGVENMQLQYLVAGAGAYVDASLVPPARWAEVTAVRIALNIASTDRAGVGNTRLQRTVAHTATLRNRLP
jgi:type IV pilus assembly protein PilW